VPRVGCWQVRCRRVMVVHIFTVEFDTLGSGLCALVGLGLLGVMEAE